jgi:hypothetical protein
MYTALRRKSTDLLAQNQNNGGRRGCYRMLVGFKTTYAISANHH